MPQNNACCILQAETWSGSEGNRTRDRAGHVHAAGEVKLLEVKLKSNCLGVESDTETVSLSVSDSLGQRTSQTAKSCFAQRKLTSLKRVKVSTVFMSL